MLEVPLADHILTTILIQSAISFASQIWSVQYLNIKHQSQAQISRKLVGIALLYKYHFNYFLSHFQYVILELDTG